MQRSASSSSYAFELSPFRGLGGPPHRPIRVIDPDVARLRRDLSNMSHHPRWAAQKEGKRSTMNLMMRSGSTEAIDAAKAKKKKKGYVRMRVPRDAPRPPPWGVPEPLDDDRRRILKSSASLPALGLPRGGAVAQPHDGGAADDGAVPSSTRPQELAIAAAAPVRAPPPAAPAPAMAAPPPPPPLPPWPNLADLELLPPPPPPRRVPTRERMWRERIRLNEEGRGPDPVAVFCLRKHGRRFLPGGLASQMAGSDGDSSTIMIANARLAQMVNGVPMVRGVPGKLQPIAS